MTKEGIFQLIEGGDSLDLQGGQSSQKERSTAGKVYDWVMMLAIVVSLVPLCFKGTIQVLRVAELCCTVLFIIDYLLRLYTADLKLGLGKRSYVRYPFTGWAIIDLLSILPGLMELNPAFRAFRVTRFLKIIRAFRLFRYSKSLNMVIRSLKRRAELLKCVAVIATAYVLLSALVVFNIEPQTFNTFFDAIYWSCISLTTVGYGDITCVTSIGRFFAILSSAFGVAIIALPAGIITSGFIEESSEQRIAALRQERAERDRLQEERDRRQDELIQSIARDSDSWSE